MNASATSGGDAVNGTPRQKAAAWLAVALVVSIGCGGPEQVELHPVSGKVMLRQKPAAGAIVVFHDTRPPDELRAQQLPIPRATTQADGTFQLSSYSQDQAAPDGAPAGSYRVTVTLPAAAAPAGADPESVGSVADQLRGRYADATTTALSADVKAGDNPLPPFELQ